MRLLVDAMCGGIVSYLRMCGHDTVYALDRGLETDGSLTAVTTEENRRLITRDRDLATATPGAICLSTTDTVAQLEELQAAGIDMTLSQRPQYCGNCNGELRVIDPEERSTTPAHTPDPTAETVYTCRDCGQYFWRGSHWKQVKETLAEI